MSRRKIAGVQGGAATGKGAEIGKGVGRGSAAEIARRAETGRKEAVPGREEGLNYYLCFNKFYEPTFNSLRQLHRLIL